MDLLTWVKEAREKREADPRINETPRALWLIYLILTVACALAYGIAGMS